jgi:Flp pilus assembly protein protease CpaA
MQTLILALGTVILMAAAYGDVQMRRIPNILSYSLAVLGVSQLILIGDLSAAVWTIGSAIAVLVVGFLLFWGGVFGGGEAKLLTGATLLIGSRDLPGFLWLVSFCALIAMLALMIEYDLGRWLRRLLGLTTERNATAEGAAAEARPTVPYGIAIAVGAVVMLLARAIPST